MHVLFAEISQEVNAIRSFMAAVPVFPGIEEAIVVAGTVCVREIVMRRLRGEYTFERGAAR